MTSEAKEVAAEVIRQLGGNVIDAELPEALATIVRDRCRHGGVVEIHTLAALGPMAPSIDYTFSPSGSIAIEICDAQRNPVWRGTLRPKPVQEPA